MWFTSFELLRHLSESLLCDYIRNIHARYATKHACILNDFESAFQQQATCRFDQECVGQIGIHSASASASALCCTFSLCFSSLS